MNQMMILLAGCSLLGGCMATVSPRGDVAVSYAVPVQEEILVPSYVTVASVPRPLVYGKPFPLIFHKPKPRPRPIVHPMPHAVGPSHPHSGGQGHHPGGNGHQPGHGGHHPQQPGGGHIGGQGPSHPTPSVQRVPTAHTGFGHVKTKR